jgi:ribosome modulation factor
MMKFYGNPCDEINHGTYKTAETRSGWLAGWQRH